MKLSGSIGLYCVCVPSFLMPQCYVTWHISRQPQPVSLVTCADSLRVDSAKDQVKESEGEPPAVVPKPGEIEDLVRVDRRKLEELILGEQ